MRKHIVGSTLALAAVLVAGCSTESASPTGSDAPSAARAAADPEFDFIRTSGEGEVAVTAPAPAVGLSAFTFGAVQHKDGSVTGEFRVVRQRAGFTVDFTGSVTCVSIDRVNHRAWIGGVVTANNSNDPNHSLAIHQVGRDVWFRVQDNGEGSNATGPDRSTVLGFEGGGGVITSAEYCQRQLWTAGNVNAFEVVTGNIQVR